MTVTLYERTEALAIVHEWIEEHGEEILAAGGELPPELAALLDEAALDFEEKVARVALMVREHLANAAAVKVERERLERREKALTNAAEGLKGYLHFHLNHAGVSQVKRPVVTVRLQKNSAPTIVATPPLETLPEELVEVPPPPPPRLNSKALLNWYREGKVLPEGCVVEVRNHVRIA